MGDNTGEVSEEGEDVVRYERAVNLLRSWAEANKPGVWERMEPQLRRKQLERQLGWDGDGEVFP